LKTAAAWSLPAAKIAAQTQTRRLEPIGLQLFTLRALMKADWARTLEQVAAIGYREVEFAGYFGASLLDVRRTLNSVGLRAPSAHFTLTDLTDRLESTLETAAAVGHTFVILANLGR